MKYLIILVIPILILCCKSNQSRIVEHKGEPLPEFSVLLPDSTTYFNTNSIQEGKATVLFYFRPDCPYSQAEMESIIKEINHFKNIQFIVLTAANFNEMKWFYEKNQLSKYNNIKAGVDYNLFMRSYFTKIIGVPFMAIYGSDGRLKETISGLAPISFLKKSIPS